MSDEKRRRNRGEGSLYKKPGSAYYWLSFTAGGERVRESAKTKNKKAAQDLLTARLAAVTGGTYTGPDAAPLTFEMIADGLRADYRLRGRRSVVRLERALGHLAGHFAGWQVRAITAGAVAAYHAERLDAKVAQASVHYEIAILKRAFTVARKNGQHTGRLEYTLGAVDNARQGFFERADLEALRAELPAHLRALVTFAYLTGWRRQEILDLRWRDVDFAGGMVRLEPGTTKNGEGRAFAFGALPELVDVLRAQRETTTAVERLSGAIVPYVFHRNGRPIRYFDHAWHSACDRAAHEERDGLRVLVRPQLVGRILHDFRRSAVRNLERAGVPRSVAMAITGHKTEAVYRRYAIVAEADLNAAAAKLATLAERDAEQRAGVLPFPKTGTDR